MSEKIKDIFLIFQIGRRWKIKMTTKQFNIRKKIAKHGNNSIIVIPKLLQGELKPKMVVDLEIKVVETAEEERK